MDLSFWHGKTILILGGAGFIGSHLTEVLVSKGAEITVLDLPSMNSANLRNVFNQVEIIKSNILELDWSSFFQKRKIDYVFNMTGNANVPYSVENPPYDFEANLLTSYSILEAMRKTNWDGVFIFPSSAAVYGNPYRIPITEEDPTIPISPYGVSKLCVERYISVYSKLYGIKAASVRPFSVYGPRQRKMAVYDLITKLIMNPHEIDVFGDGTQKRDFLFIKDTIQGLLIMAESGEHIGEVYNLASGSEYSILELISKLCKIMKIHPKLNFSGEVRSGEPEKWKADISKISNLGFVSETSLEEGLGSTIEWIRGNSLDINRL